MEQQRLQATTWIIEILPSGEVRPIEELVQGELLKRYKGTFPTEPGTYQWRPTGISGYETDPATGGAEKVEWGWGKEVIPENEWTRGRIFPVGI